MRKHLFVLGALLLVLLLVAGCSGKEKSAQQPPQQQSEKPASSTQESGGSTAGSQQQAPKVVLRLASAMPLDYITSLAIMNVFKPSVEKKSGGAIEVQFFPAGQLFVDKDLNQAAITGSVEVVTNTYTWWTAFDPAADWQTLPLLFDSQEESLRLMRGEIGKELGKLTEENGVAFINWLHGGTVDGLMTMKGPIKVPADLKGMKIRTYNDLHNKWFKALGASSITMSSSEVYMGLQRGTIDGVFSATESGVTRKWFEVAKYDSLVPGGVTSHSLVANKNWFNKLTPDQQKAVMEAGQEAEAWTGDNIAKSYQKNVEDAKKMGVAIYAPTPQELAEWRKQSQPVYDFYVQAGGDRAKKLLDLTFASKK